MEEQENIERLTEERDMYADDLYWKAEVRKREDFITELTVENAELQKQVDELKQENSVLSVTIGLQEEIEKQAVKDTMKDLLIEFNEWINEHYDSKLDAYSIHIPVHKVNSFLTGKAKEYGLGAE